MKRTMLSLVLLAALSGLAAAQYGNLAVSVTATETGHSITGRGTGYGVSGNSAWMFSDNVVSSSSLSASASIGSPSIGRDQASGYGSVTTSTVGYTITVMPPRQ